MAGKSTLLGWITLEIVKDNCNMDLFDLMISILRLRGHGVRLVVDYADTQISRISSWKKLRNCFSLFKRAQVEIWQKGVENLVTRSPLQHVLGKVEARSARGSVMSSLLGAISCVVNPEMASVGLAPYAFYCRYAWPQKCPYLGVYSARHMSQEEKGHSVWPQFKVFQLHKRIKIF